MHLSAVEIMNWTKYTTSTTIAVRMMVQIEILVLLKAQSGIIIPALNTRRGDLMDIIEPKWMCILA